MTAIMRLVDGASTIEIGRRTMPDLYEAIHILESDGYTLDDSPQVVGIYYLARLTKNKEII